MASYSSKRRRIRGQLQKNKGDIQDYVDGLNDTFVADGSSLGMSNANIPSRVSQQAEQNVSAAFEIVEDGVDSTSALSDSTDLSFEDDLDQDDCEYFDYIENSDQEAQESSDDDELDDHSESSYNLDRPLALWALVG
jgi:hypothetical protein